MQKVITILIATLFLLFNIPSYAVDVQDASYVTLTVNNQTNLNCHGFVINQGWFLADKMDFTIGPRQAYTTTLGPSAITGGVTANGSVTCVLNALNFYILHMKYFQQDIIANISKKDDDLAASLSSTEGTVTSPSSVVLNIS